MLGLNCGQPCQDVLDRQTSVIERQEEAIQELNAQLITLKQEMRLINTKVNKMPETQGSIFFIKYLIISRILMFD